MNILVLEDDTATAERMQEMIEQFGHHAETCVDTRSALRRAGEQAFDLFLLDLFLPDGKGHAIIPVLHRLCPGIPIATMTGYNSRELELKVRELGVITYLIKPIQSSVLLALLDHVEKRRQEAENEPYFIRNHNTG
jgi:two-component system cell cycle response regulator CtrA